MLYTSEVFKAWINDLRLDMGLVPYDSNYTNRDYKLTKWGTSHHKLNLLQFSLD
jgi:hypothetical protein